MGIDLSLRKLSQQVNEAEKATTNLILAHNWVMDQFKYELERFNITAQQFNILRILKSEAKPLSTMQIRDRMLDKMSDTSRIVDRLVAKDLVNKKVSALDKRLVDVIISQKGLALLERLEAEDITMEKSLASLTPSEVNTLNELLAKIRATENPDEPKVLKPIM